MAWVTFVPMPMLWETFKYFLTMLYFIKLTSLWLKWIILFSKSGLLCIRTVNYITKGLKVLENKRNAEKFKKIKCIDVGDSEIQFYSSYCPVRGHFSKSIGCLTWIWQVLVNLALFFPFSSREISFHLKALPYWGTPWLESA